MPALPLDSQRIVEFLSDGEACWFSEGAGQVALIGPGVDAWHAYERPTRDNTLPCARLIAQYLVS